MRPPGAAWEAARHALGRLFSRASVRSVSDAQRLPQAQVHLSEAVGLLVVPPGHSERSWPIVAVVCPSSPSKIEVRLSARDRRPTATVVAGSQALAPPECRAMDVLRASGAKTGGVEILRPAEVVRLPDFFIKLPPQPVRLWRTPLLTLPKNLSAWALTTVRPKVKVLRMPRPPLVRSGAARVGEVALSRVPLLRRGLEAPRGVPLSAAFSAEHRRLAETAELPLHDVVLLGVYPSIPIIAVRRLVIEDEGRLLRLWLKPESWWGKPPPRRITLLVGRQISTGKMLQAAG